MANKRYQISPIGCDQYDFLNSYVIYETDDLEDAKREINKGYDYIYGVGIYDNVVGDVVVCRRNVQ